MRKGLLGAVVVLAVALMALAPSAQAKNVYKFRFSSFVPPLHFMNKGILEPWIKEVEKRSGGRIKIRLFPGSALGKPRDQYDMAARGVADITWGILAYTPGRFPLSTVIELPFMVPTAEVGSRVIQTLYQEGMFGNEFNDVHLLGLATPPAMDLHTRKKKVTALAGVKGLKIRTPSPMIGKLITRWGGVPVGMTLNEVYLSLERGVIDAVFLDPLTFRGIRADEVTKQHTLVGISTTAVFFAMNKKAWDSLPPDLQKIMTEMTGMYLSVDLNGKMADGAVAATWKMLKKAGHQVVILTPEEKAKWVKAAQPAVDAWIAAMEAKGLPGKKVYERAVALRDKFMRK